MPYNPGEDLPVLEILEMLGIHYYIAGSIASSAYGFPRATMDIDIVADIKHEHVDILVKKFKSNYYIDSEMIYGAIQMESSFNLIHLESLSCLSFYLCPSCHQKRTLLFGEQITNEVLLRLPHRQLLIL